MGNTGLLRREAEMTLLQPHLGDTRHQELRHFGLRNFGLPLAPLRNNRVLDPIKITPFVVPTVKKSHRKNPYGGNSSQSSNQSFFCKGVQGSLLTPL